MRIGSIHEYDLKQPVVTGSGRVANTHRWQIELCFKEWKSYANLHQFDTANPHIAEGLIWASILHALVTAMRLGVWLLGALRWRD